MEESNTSEKDGPRHAPRPLVRVPDERRREALERLFGPVEFASGLPTDFLRRNG